MNVMYHLRSFPKLSESFILNEIYTLVKRGHRVAVFAFNNPGDEIVNSEFQCIDIPIRYAKPIKSYDGLRAVWSLLPSLTRVKGVPKDAGKAIRDLFFARQLQDFIEDIDWEPQVIHGHFASGMRTSAQIAANAFEIPHLITCHANDIYDRENRATARRVLNDADRVITVCESNREFIKSDLEVTTPVDIVPASIRLEKFEPTTMPIDNRVLTVARLTEKKGLDYAIDAISDLRQKVPGISYHVIGSGELRASLEEKISEEGLSKQVTLLGQVTESQLLEELDMAQVFLLPCVITSNGDRDATPVVLKEAMAMGTPCVSTDVGGIPEVVDDGENGLIVPSRDIDAISAAVGTILTDDDRRARFGQDARSKASLFDIGRNIKLLEATMESDLRR